MKKSLLVGAGFLGAMLLAAPAMAATQMKAGYYLVLHFVTAANVNGAGSCLEPVGAYYNSQVYYPGPSKKGYTSYIWFSTNAVFGNEIESYPETQAAGVSTWSGNYTSQFLPGGKAITGTFNTTETITDANSGIAATTLTYPVTGGGTCTTTLQLNQLYTGK